MATTGQTGYKKMSPSVFKNEYYGPLLQSYVSSIINSRMLLDEDLEVLINTYEFSISNEFKPTNFPYVLVTALGSLIGSSLAVKVLRGSPVFLIPPGIVTTIVAVQEIRYRLKKQRHYKLINELIIVLNDFAKLLNRIYRYFQSRNKVKDRYVSDFFNAYNKFVINFMDSFSNSQLELNEFYFNNLIEISKFCDMLAEDCQNYPNPTNFLKQTDPDVEKFFSTIEKFEKVQVLVNSKLLGYLGVIFCDKSSKLNQIGLDLILNVRIPNIIKNTRRQFSYISRLFMKLKESVIQLTRHKIQSLSVNKDFISKKLNVALENTLYNLSFVTEKTHNILEAIEKHGRDDTATIAKISKGLIDLRKHTFSTFESLDLLCNMYGILAIPETPNEKSLTEPKATSSQAPDKEIKIISYDDEQKTSDEYYELYLEKQFDDLQEPYYEEKSDSNVTLLLQELKQALNNHERFLEARKKREKFEIDQTPTPAPRKSKTNIPDDEKIKTTEFAPPGSSKFEIPSPPPLPLPAPNIVEHVSVPNHSELLEGIKLLASQLNCKEETFGSDGSISEDD